MRLAVALAAFALPATLSAQYQQGTPLRADQQLAHDIYKELVEINTADSVGSTTVAASAVAKRFRDAGFRGRPTSSRAARGRTRATSSSGITATGRAGASRCCSSRTSTSSRRSRTTGRPISIRSSSPSATATTTAAVRATTRRWRRSSSPTLIRFKQEHYVPDRDIILALTADEEGGPANGVRWLHRQPPRADRRRVRAQRRRRRRAARRQAVHQLGRRGGEGVGELHRVDGESRRTLVGAARRQRDL